MEIGDAVIYRPGDGREVSGKVQDIDYTTWQFLIQFDDPDLLPNVMWCGAAYVEFVDLPRGKTCECGSMSIGLKHHHAHWCPLFSKNN